MPHRRREPLETLWRERLAAGTLEDLKPGLALHAITPDEEAAIVRVFEEHGLTDRSHRKLAHRGSYEQIVWVSESTVRRVLAAHGLRVRAPRRAGRSQRSPFPEWAEYAKHSIWIYDTTRFARCRSTYVVMIMDLVTRKWICEVVSAEETGLQIQPRSPWHSSKRACWTPSTSISASSPTRPSTTRPARSSWPSLI